MREIGIMEVGGFRVGHAQNWEAATGCTVLLCDQMSPAGWMSGAEDPPPGSPSSCLPWPRQMPSTRCCSPAAAPSDWTPPAVSSAIWRSGESALT